MDSKLAISSVNYQGLCNVQKRKDVFHYLWSENHNTYFLQDTHFDSKIEKHVTAKWGYTWFFSSNNFSSRGVAIMLSILIQSKKGYQRRKWELFNCFA